MKPIVIDPKTTTRAAAFDLWMNAPNPMVTFFKTLDVTPLIHLSRRRGLKFNMLLCWCIGKAASGIREFYTLPVGRELLQYLAAYSYTENGVTVEEPEQRNPYYITGMKRQVYEFLQDLTPSSQVIQVSEMGVKKPVMLAVYDGLILLLVTGFGLIFFRREDLK